MVEPSRSQNKIVLRQFEALGIRQYSCFQTGSEALESIFNDVPDLVINALHLEDMTGPELVLKMRENSATINTPFILISTTTSFSELDTIKQAGASAVLPKPVDDKALKPAVLTTMEWENPDRIVLEDMDTESLRVLLVDDSAMARKNFTI